MLTLVEPPRLPSPHPAQFDALYDELSAPVFKYCLRLTRCEADAADATQDVFITLAEKLPELRAREVAMAPYVFTIARNASFDLLRRRRRRSEVEFGLGGSGPVDHQEGPDACALRAADRSTLRTGLDKLPARQRRALLLREVAGCSYDEIADDLQINRNAVAQLLHRSKGTLRRHVAPFEAAA